MAKLDYSPVPDVAADTSAPDDLQRIQASPAAFGAGVSQAAEGLGQAAISTAKFYGQVAADQQTNNYLDARDAILNGDPSKTVTGPDGTPTPDTGFLGLRGQAALEAWPSVKTQLDELGSKLGDQVPTPEAREIFENQTRRYRAQALQQAGSHVDQQQRVWAEGTNLTSIQMGLNAAAASPMNDDAVAQATDHVRNAYIKNAQIFPEKYGTPELATLRADQDVTLARLRSLTGAGDPASAQQAQKVLDDNRGVLGSLPNYDAIAHQVKGAVIEATMMPAIGAAVGDAMGEAQRSVGTPGSAPVRDMSNVPFAEVKSGIINHEAPASVGGYNALAYNTPSGGNAAGLQPVNLTGMTIGQVIDYQHNVMRPATAGHRGAGDVGSTGVGAYQFESGTLAQNAQAAFGADWRNQPFSPANQDKIAETLYNSIRGDRTALHNTWAAFAGQGGGQYPSVADALNANMNATVEKAQTDAARLFPNYPDAQDRYVMGVRRRLEQTVAQQHQDYEVQTHIVQAAMASDNPPISEQQLVASSPQVAQAWHSMQINNPYGAMAVERMFDANAKGRAVGYGSEFKSYLDRVLAPSTDPGRVTNPQQLWGFVGAGANAPLTNSGVNQLATLLEGRGTPQGEADAAQMRQFVDNMHATLTFSNKSTGLYDAKGEAKFGQYMAAVLPAMVAAQKQGNLAQILNPASKDYIGAAAQTFMRNPSDVMKDRLTAQAGVAALPPFTFQTLNRTLDELDNDAQRKEALKSAVAQHRISIQAATAIGVKRGYIQGASVQRNPVAEIGAEWAGQ